MHTTVGDELGSIHRNFQSPWRRFVRFPLSEAGAVARTQCRGLLVAELVAEARVL